jgi:hypothetical protein
LVLGHKMKLSTNPLGGQGKCLVTIDRKGEAGDALGRTDECGL